MHKIKCFFTKSLCIFLAVLILFFGVSNSYFSPHKIDKVEAGAIVVPAVAITIDVIIKLICAVGVACLGVGIINELSDMDFNAVLDNVHSWLRENITVLDGLNIDGTSALKEWAQADEWTIVESEGGNFEPSPDPSHSPSKVPDVSPFSLTAVAELASAGVLWSEIYSTNYEQTEPYSKVANAYLQDKIVDYPITSPNADPITDALKGRYGEGTFSGYKGLPEKQEDGLYHFPITVTSINKLTNTRTVSTVVAKSSNQKVGTYLRTEKIGNYIYTSISVLGFYDVFNTMYNPDGTSITTTSNSGYCYVGCSNPDIQYFVNSALPIFQNQADYLSWLDGGDATILNRANNYIDTNDDYGWASTANLSPNDLAQALPGLAGNLNNAYVSLEGLQTAINALKAQLEDLNPNTNPSIAPVPYPTISDYPGIVEGVVTDPSIFPQTNPNPKPSTDPNPSPSSNPSPQPSVKPDDPDSNKKPIVDLKQFFPFCIPFDLIHLFEVLVAEPVPPKFEIPFKYSKIGLDYTFVIDFRQFEELAEIFRTGQTLLFCLGLILITRNIIKG